MPDFPDAQARRAVHIAEALNAADQIVKLTSGQRGSDAAATTNAAPALRWHFLVLSESARAMRDER